jgi:preprotein translocase subunit SecG
LTLYLNIIQIILSIALITLAVLQSRNSALGRMFGGDSSIHRTRRGAEKTMFSMTIVIAALFFATAFISVIINKGG